MINIVAYKLHCIRIMCSFLCVKLLEVTMKDTVFVGIDVGTTKVKAGIIDENGKMIVLKSTSVDIQRPFMDAVEIDMAGLWRKVESVLKELIAECPADVIKKICGVGVSGQGDGLWAIDKSGLPVGNAILWNDTRAKKLKLENSDLIDKLCRESYVTPFFTGSMPMILQWLKINQPERCKKFHKIFHCKDWINYKLTGEIVSDYSDMSICMMNVKERKFVDDLFRAAGLEKEKKLLPEIVTSDTVIGKISKDASLATGIPEGVPVIAGSIDVAAVAIGLGASQSGDACSILGTTLCSQVVVDARNLNKEIQGGGALCHIAEGYLLRFMATSSGTSALDWVKTQMFESMGYPELEKIISGYDIGANGLVFHPYIYGERAPFNNPRATGGFFGLLSSHDKYHLARAAFEGVVFSIKDCFDNLPETTEQIKIGGGAAKSDLLCTMISDCLGKRVIRPSTTEFGIKGIAATIAKSQNLRADYNIFASSDQTMFDFDNDKHKKYVDAFDVFKRLAQDMTNFWNR